MATAPNTAAPVACPTTIEAFQAAYDRAAEAYNANDALTCCKPKDGKDVRRQDAMTGLHLQMGGLQSAILREVPTSASDALLILAHVVDVTECVGTFEVPDKNDIDALKIASENLLAFYAQGLGVAGDGSRFLSSVIEYSTEGASNRALREAA